MFKIRWEDDFDELKKRLKLKYVPCLKCGGRVEIFRYGSLAGYTSYRFQCQDCDYKSDFYQVLPEEALVVLMTNAWNEHNFKVDENAKMSNAEVLKYGTDEEKEKVICSKMVGCSDLCPFYDNSYTTGNECQLKKWLQEDNIVL